MKPLLAILREIVGLFVDDGYFAIVILVWVAATVLILPRLGWLHSSRGIILFCGLAVILVESAVRYSQSKAR